MNYTIPSLQRLIEQFCRLPGVGKKSAERLAFYLISKPESECKAFADAIMEAKNNVHTCRKCMNITDKEVCDICGDVKRDQTTICVVEDEKDVPVFERTGEYHGLYHVLHGTISPLDGIGPEDIKIKELMARLSDSTVKEVIMATNPTVEGEATASYLSRLIKPMGIKITRLALGIPIGSDLEFADEVTLSHALEGRKEI